MHVQRLQPDDLTRCARLAPPWLAGAEGAPAREMLARWVRCGRLVGAVYVDQAPASPFGLAMSGVMDGDVVRRFLDDPGGSLLDHVVAHGRQGHELLLDPGEAPAVHAAGRLHVVVLWHELASIDPADPRAQLAFRVGAQIYRLLHAGWSQLAAVMHETPASHHAAMQAGGLHLWAATGDRAVFGLRRHEVAPVGGPDSLAASLFRSPPMVLGLSAAQRRVAELGLWQWDDARIAAELGIEPATVRRHWRDIAARMSHLWPQPQSLLSDAGPRGTRGPARRRQILDYLREHLQEIRP